jgi:hypothetical protein
MLDLFQHALMLLSRGLIIPMHIPLSTPARMEIVILSPLQRHLRNHVGIARGDGGLLRLEAGGVDVACTASL